MMWERLRTRLADLYLMACVAMIVAVLVVAYLFCCVAASLGKMSAARKMRSLKVSSQETHGRALSDLSDAYCQYLYWREGYDQGHDPWEPIWVNDSTGILRKRGLATKVVHLGYEGLELAPGVIEAVASMPQTPHPVPAYAE